MHHRNTPYKPVAAQENVIVQPLPKTGWQKSLNHFSRHLIRHAALLIIIHFAKTEIVSRKSRLQDIKLQTIVLFLQISRALPETVPSEGMIQPPLHSLRIKIIKKCTLQTSLGKDLPILLVASVNHIGQCVHLSVGISHKVTRHRIIIYMNRQAAQREHKNHCCHRNE